MSGQLFLRAGRAVRGIPGAGAAGPPVNRRRWLAAAALSFAVVGLSRAATTVVDGHASYPECPLWHEGRLFFVEYAADDIKVWDGRSLAIYWKKEHCGPSGLAEFGAGHLLVACYDSNSLVELDGRGVELRSISADDRGRAFTGPNDFASDGAGGLYFSASGEYDIRAPITGTVLHLSKEGVATELAGTIHYSNGLALSHDGKHLLVAEMLAGRILEFPILADGSLGPRRVWARLSDLAPPTSGTDAYNGPDGVRAGADGNYYIAQNGSGRVLVVDEQRKLVRQIRLPTRYVTNVGFGPDGPGTLYITGLFDAWHAPYAGVVYRWTR